MGKMLIIRVLIALLVFGGMFLPSYAGEKHGKFYKLENLYLEDANKPVYLKNGNIFFAGGQNTATKHIVFPKMYNIETKTVQDINKSMNVPRNNYNVADLDKTHSKVLIVGGTCVEEVPDCAKVAEIFDISKSEFTRIDNAKLDFGDNGTMYRYDDTIILVNSLGIQEFDIENKTFSVVHKFDENYKYDIYSQEIGSGEIFIYGKKYKAGEEKPEYVNFTVAYIVADKTLKPVDTDFSKEYIHPIENSTAIISQTPDGTTRLKLYVLTLSEDKSEYILSTFFTEYYYHKTLILPEDVKITHVSDEYFIMALSEDYKVYVNCLLYNLPRNKVKKMLFSEKNFHNIHMTDLGDKNILISGTEGEHPILYTPYKRQPSMFSEILARACEIEFMFLTFMISAHEQ